MATVSLDTRFIGIAPSVNLEEKKSGRNNLVSEPYTMQEIVNTATGGSSPTGIPYENYPPAGLTTAGAKFTYTDGVELISYHIKGISSISANPASGFDLDLCTINFPEIGMGIEAYPGSLTGMFQSGTGPNFILSPLAIGGLIEVDGNHIPLTEFQMSLVSYNNNPQPDGSYNYTLSAVGDSGVSGNLTGLMAYDFEFLLPNYLQAPSIITIPTPSYYTYSLGNGDTENIQCLLPPNFPSNYYSSSSSLIIGTQLFTDTGLTTFAAEDAYFNTSGKYNVTTLGTITTILNPANQIYQSYTCLGSSVSQIDACSGSPIFTAYASCGTVFDNGARIYGNALLNQPYTTTDYIAIGGPSMGGIFTFTVTNFATYSELGNKTAC